MSRAPTTTMSGQVCRYTSTSATSTSQLPILYVVNESTDDGCLLGAASADLRGGKAKEVLDVRSRDLLCGCGYLEFDDCVRIR